MDRSFDRDEPVDSVARWPAIDPLDDEAPGFAQVCIYREPDDSEISSAGNRRLPNAIRTLAARR